MKSDEQEKYGTVGCVALDKFGNIAAGTSTGGMSNKRWGRIGDVPIVALEHMLTIKRAPSLLLVRENILFDQQLRMIFPQ